MEKVLTANKLSVVDGFEDETQEVRDLQRAVFRGDWESFKRAWSPDMDADEVRRAVCGYFRKALLNASDLEKGLAIAEALKEISYRVEDSNQQNNVLARLFIATARMSLIERS